MLHAVRHRIDFLSPSTHRICAVGINIYPAELDNIVLQYYTPYGILHPLTDILEAFLSNAVTQCRLFLLSMLHRDASLFRRDALSIFRVWNFTLAWDAFQYILTCGRYCTTVHHGQLHRLSHIINTHTVSFGKLPNRISRIYKMGLFITTAPTV
jgi:hypothetical protein